MNDFVKNLICIAALLAHDEVSDRLGIEQADDCSECDQDPALWRKFDALNAFGDFLDGEDWVVSPALEEYLADREAFREADQRLLRYAA